MLMYATFDTKHLRMQLHTGLVMGVHGNGLPIFNESILEADVSFCEGPDRPK
jgi:hypothetical protein